MASAARSRAGGSGPGDTGARRLRVRVTGTVQGVGFRPYVFRLAEELGLSGFVLNDEHGVVIEAEGPAAELEALLERLPRETPPLAEIEAIEPAVIEACGSGSFEIAASESAGEAEAAVSPDFATCEDCLAELLDPADRRHRYPFTNCTNCGPRFSIVRSVPYDRPATTMAGFEMCARCRAEYEDPRDRRFHAQPNACPDCGPRASLRDRRGKSAERWLEAVAGGPADDPIGATAAALLAGRIVAIKGIGGYHLACRADSEDAVAKLRARKHREEKAFALMVADLGAAERIVELSAGERRLLAGRERPIVIARRRGGPAAGTAAADDRAADGAALVAPSVAPRSRDLGVMLPYTPLHHLLAADLATLGTDEPGPPPPLVMTSGNLSDEPIAYEDADAAGRLREVADLICGHDRAIHIRTDDTVLRSLDPALREAPLLIRRSRGFAPRSIPLPGGTPAPILGVGAELKNTFCLAKGDRAWPGHHIGDLKNWETLDSFRSGIEHFQRVFAIEPEVVAHDLHPDYLSTVHAIEQHGLRPVAVQHHHAHLAACLAEHGVEGGAVGAIFDGTGYGDDRTVWGGELLSGDCRSCERVGMLFPVRLAGGDAAVKAPWRLACAWLAAAGGVEVPVQPAALAERVGQGDWEAVARLAASGVASPLTSSVGRLFDAVAALCGIGITVSHEGQAATELEAISDPLERGSYPVELLNGAGEGPLIIDPRAAIAAIAAEVQSGVAPALVGARFHTGLAAASAEACAIEAERGGLETVVLSGGVFQNRLLLERCHSLVAASGLRVLIPTLLPPNDGGIAYGQVAVAAARLRAGE